MDLVRYGLNLTGVRAAANHKKIGEGSDVAEIQDANVFSLLFLSSANGREPAAWHRGFRLFQFPRTGQ
jgi:hypothetical protein